MTARTGRIMSVTERKTLGRIQGIHHSWVCARMLRCRAKARFSLPLPQPSPCPSRCDGDRARWSSSTPPVIPDAAKNFVDSRGPCDIEADNLPEKRAWCLP